MAARVNRLFVNNLPWTVSVKELREYFSQFGLIRSANVIFDKETGMSKGFGFVEFNDNDSAKTALSKGNHVLDSCLINAQLSNDRENQ